LHGVHFDSQFTPPPFFREYYTPYYQEFSKLLHENGKYLSCHADSDTSLILDEIMDAGFDMAECFVTHPMVPCTLEQARGAWGDKVVIWGGIPSIMVCEPVTDQRFEEYMTHVFETIAPGDAFIFGVADNVMPEAKIERIRRVTEMVQEYGYPIRT
jgi:uroporphyrinogen-III decarboxylase